jgi:hypothetical protein
MGYGKPVIDESRPGHYHYGVIDPRHLNLCGMDGTDLMVERIFLLLPPEGALPF